MANESERAGVPSRPDVVVGVDFGMCYTAVVYSTPAINPFYSAPIVFEGWPDRPPQSFQNQTDVKVPTSLAYSHENDTDQLPTAWGFGVNAVVQGAEPGSVQEYFKTRLQPDEKNIGLGSTDRCAKQLIKDYLRSLHDCIRSSFPGKIHEQAWGDAKILFVFSFPAIWTPETVNLFRSIAASVGFETPDGNHYVEARLSEPAAAAVHTVKSGMEGIKIGNSILMVDTGGGTTDLSLVTVKKLQRNTIEVSVQEPTSDYAGGAFIDGAFLGLVIERLKAAQGLTLSYQDAERIAWKVMRGRVYQNGKKDLQQMLKDGRTLDVRLLPSSSENTFAASSIVEGVMEVTAKDLASLFDPEIEKIMKMIDYYIQNKSRTAFDEQKPVILDHIVLSGGLACSEYVLGRLQEQFDGSRWDHLIKVPPIRVSPSPTTCVAKGLVIEATQRIASNQPVVAYFYSRLAYGVVFRRKKFSRMSTNKDREKDTAKILESSSMDIKWMIRPSCSISPGEWHSSEQYHFIRCAAESDSASAFHGELLIVSRGDGSPDHPYWAFGPLRIFKTIKCDFKPCVVAEPWSDKLIRPFYASDQAKVKFRISARMGQNGVEFKCETSGGGDSIQI